MHACMHSCDRKKKDVEGDFLKTIDSFRSPHLWEKNEKDQWQLKKKVY